MSNPLLALFSAAALLTGTPKDGESWLRESESRLYSWPEPGVVVSFHVRTDAIQQMIDALKKQLPPDPTPDMLKSIDALRRIEITGTVDTATGKTTTRIDLTIDANDPKRKEGVEKLKNGIDSMVAKFFDSLPLHDPGIAKDKKVLEASESGSTLTVKLSGKTPDEETTLRLDKNRMLPETFDQATRSMKVRYIEVLPGRFAPARLDMQTPDSQKSSATFTYQRVGDLVFPSKVTVTQGASTTKLDFLSVRAEKAGP
ncbi:MAG: hypothetical protein ACKVXR_12245 [Planctomycetota bacterium]